MSHTSNRGKSRQSGTHAWTGNAESITVWGRMAEVGTLKAQAEFRLFGFHWIVERQARRTTFARGIDREFEGLRIQIKKSRLVDTPYRLVAE